MGRLLLVIASNGLLRVTGGASSVLVALYIAELANGGRPFGAGLVSTLAADLFGAELLGAVPLGMLVDAVPTRTLMTSGASLAGAATWLLGQTQGVSVFVLSRTLEGLAAAAVVPALLAHLTDATAAQPRSRARAMSYFGLSLLAGLALGGLLGTQLWTRYHLGAFTALAVIYGAAAVLVFTGVAGGIAQRPTDPWSGLRRALGISELRRLAPI